LNTTTVSQADSPSVALGEVLRRQKRLLEIVESGLPPFPHTVLELTATLGGPSADVKKAAKLIRTDPSLSAQVLRMCNSPMFGLRSRVIGIEQAATLLGTDRLRTLVLTTSMVDFAGHGLPKEQVNSFWQHSFLAAMLSEHLAGRVQYREKEQAYIAGLLHDIGHVSHWMLASEEKARKRTAPPDGWFDNTSLERDYFGMDHCEVGSRMATSWNFMPSFIDVLVHHHQAREAQHDPYLVQIVGAVEHFLLTKPPVEPPIDEVSQIPNGSPLSDIDPPVAPVRSYQPYNDSEWKAIAESLEVEHARLLPIVQRGLTSVISGTA